MDLLLIEDPMFFVYRYYAWMIFSINLIFVKEKN
jgi:hypothetical protein